MEVGFVLRVWGGGRVRRGQGGPTHMYPHGHTGTVWDRERVPDRVHPESLVRLLSSVSSVLMSLSTLEIKASVGRTQV